MNANFVFFAQFVDHDLTNTFPKPIPQQPFLSQFNVAQQLCCGTPNTNFSPPFVPPTPRTRFWCIPMKFWSKKVVVYYKE